MSQPSKAKKHTVAEAKKPPTPGIISQVVASIFPDSFDGGRQDYATAPSDLPAVRAMPITDINSLAVSGAANTRKLLPTPMCYHKGVEKAYNPSWPVVDWYKTPERIKAYNDGRSMDECLFAVTRNEQGVIIKYTSKPRHEVSLFNTPFTGDLRYPQELKTMNVYAALDESLTTTHKHISSRNSEDALSVNPDPKSVQARLATDGIVIPIGFDQMTRLLPEAKLQQPDGEYKIIVHYIRLIEENSNFLVTFDKVFLASNSESLYAKEHPVAWSNATTYTNIAADLVQTNGLVYSPIPPHPRSYIPTGGEIVYQADPAKVNHWDFHRFVNYDFNGFLASLSENSYVCKDEGFDVRVDRNKVISVEWKPELYRVMDPIVWFFQEEIDDIREKCEGGDALNVKFKAEYDHYQTKLAHGLHVPYQTPKNGKHEEWTINILASSFIEIVKKKQNQFRHAELVMNAKDLTLQLAPLDSIKGWQHYKDLAYARKTMFGNSDPVYYNAKFEILFEEVKGGTLEGTAKIHTHAASTVEMPAVKTTIDQSHE